MVGKGMILPAGSPLVQFEIEQFAHGGSCNIPLPVCVWVERFHDGQKCPDGKFMFTVRAAEDNGRVSTAQPGFRPAVCACMGEFCE